MSPSSKWLSIVAVICVAGSIRQSWAADASPADIATIVPTTVHPIAVTADDHTARQAWTRAIDQYMSIPADQVTAHPAAADFPGTLRESTPTVAKDVTVPLNLPRWHSTGMYVAPGAKLTIRVSPADAARGLSIVIGSHTDSIARLAKWTRFPKVSRSFKITQPQTTVANAFGGLVYIEVPRDPKLAGYRFPTFGGYGWLDENPALNAGTATVHIDGAVPAPLFIVGQTTPAQWTEQLKSTAPWGELQSDKVILTVQTKHLGAVADPTALLAFWGQVIDTEASLAGWPKQPAPPERIVVDREISAGWMHSGYPIMAHLQSEHALLDLPTLKTKGDWGYFHELGHNHEGQPYTFGADYTEVDVNLFSMYVMQTLVGREMTAHPSLAHMDQVMESRLGPTKKADAWGNLAMYVQTIQAFGWDPLKKTIATYTTPTGSDGIKTREQKMDQWVLRYSKATGHNLADYYQLFEITCTPATRAALQPLPTWMPATLTKYAKQT